MPRKSAPALEVRLKAFKEFQELKLGAVRKDLVATMSQKYGLSKTTLYEWYRSASPIGRRAGRVAKIPELLYVVGALLGDGCIYHWRGNFQVWLVGEREFAEKFARKLSCCLGRNVPHYKYGSKNAWFVRVGNAELYFMILNIRRDLTVLDELIDEVGRSSGQLELVEGFFDAEGCVKVVREPARKTAKLCLDFCNTDLNLLKMIQKAIGEVLKIRSGFSSQQPRPPWKTAYHLRIYRKREIERFLELIPTTKLTTVKDSFAKAWFAKKDGGESSIERLSLGARPHLTS